MDLRPTLYTIGVLLAILAVSMLIPLAVDLYAGHEDWKVFFLCALVTAFFGGTLAFSYATDTSRGITIREGFLLTTLSWILLPAFGALPFWFSELGMSWTDAVFESVSGMTTTGATVITRLESAPPGILIWRALLQWLGGIGIIVMALSILPFLRVGGMQLFRTEASEKEKPLPRAAQLASSIGMVYVLLTLICAICYGLSGMLFFDAVAHAMTTLSTGGYSTFDSSFSERVTPASECVAIVFMFLSALPFVVYMKFLRGNLRSFCEEPQIPFFIGVLASLIVVLSLILVLKDSMEPLHALRYVAFNVVSAVTGTGFTSTDYGVWGPFTICLFYFLTVSGGCAGSTTCGIKMFRFQILYSVTRTQILRLIHPHGVFQPMYNGRPLPQDTAMSVMSFFFVFGFSFALMSLALSLTGLDFITSLSGAATTLSNVGPGLGPVIGPSGTFAPLPDAAKWILCAGMLLGRLELFTVLVLFAPAFWRR